MLLRDDFQPRWKLALKWGWLSFAVFILMAPVFYTMYISFNELGFGAKYYIFTFQWYESVFSDKQLIDLIQDSQVNGAPMTVFLSKLYGHKAG